MTARLPTPGNGQGSADTWLDRARNWLSEIDTKLAFLPSSITAKRTWSTGGASVSSLSAASLDIALRGAAVGDVVDVGCVHSLALAVSGQVTAADVVTVALQNVSGFAVTLPDSIDLTIIVWKVR